MNEVVITAFVSVVTSLVTWFAARRKNLADVRNSELDNVDKAVKFYREQLEHIAQRWKEATDEATQMNKLYNDAILELNKVELRFNKLAEENKALIEENKALIEENKNLIDELKKYKQLKKN